MAKGKNPHQQPILQMIRAQVHTWRALDEHQAGEEGLARQEMKETLNLVRAVSQVRGIEPMLHIHGNGRAEGWFGPGWQALAAVDWNQESSTKACEEFLACFSFNYW